MTVIILLLAVFFTLNMGGSSFAASFAAPYGGKILSRMQSALLFSLFVVIGAVVCGKYVSVTLGGKIIPAEFIGPRALIVILLSAGSSMFVANVMKIPQTTSLVTVATIAGVGLYFGRLNTGMILYMLPFWIFLPVLSFVLTYFVGGFVYPPRKANFWIYEKLVNNRQRLKMFVILSSCYNAFSVGTNNVANAVGPLQSAGFIDLLLGLAVFGLVYGSGSMVFSGTLKTAGERIVPLGLLTASIISLISGTLMIVASRLGIPQSFVMLQMAAIFAIGSLKHGKEFTFRDPLTRKTFFTWTINPFLTLLISYGLSFIIIGERL